MANKATGKERNTLKSQRVKQADHPTRSRRGDKQEREKYKLLLTGSKAALSGGELLLKKEQRKKNSERVHVYASVRTEWPDRLSGAKKT